MQKLKGALMAAVPASMVLSNAVMAQGTDYSGITSGLDASTAVTAIIAAAGLLALVGFVKWVSKKLGRFFG